MTSGGSSTLCGPGGPGAPTAAPAPASAPQPPPPRSLRVLSPSETRPAGTPPQLVIATGAEGDRRLGVPGEARDPSHLPCAAPPLSLLQGMSCKRPLRPRPLPQDLPGVSAARDFVNWRADQPPSFQPARCAVLSPPHRRSVLPAPRRSGNPCIPSPQVQRPPGRGGLQLRPLKDGGRRCLRPGERAGAAARQPRRSRLSSPPPDARRHPPCRAARRRGTWRWTSPGCSSALWTTSRGRTWRRATHRDPPHRPPPLLSAPPASRLVPHCAPSSHSQAHAVEALRRSAVRRVHLIGRRGPAQAQFTPKELRELLSLPGVRVVRLFVMITSSACLFLSRAALLDSSSRGRLPALSDCSSSTHPRPFDWKPTQKNR